jgi:hypothetical protein
LESKVYADALLFLMPSPALQVDFDLKQLMAVVLYNMTEGSQTPSFIFSLAYLDFSFFPSIDISISRVVSDVARLPVHLEFVLHLRVEVRRIVGLVACITKSLAFHPSVSPLLQRNKTHH